MFFTDHYLYFGGAANTLLRQAALMKQAKNEVKVVLNVYEEMLCAEYVKICMDNQMDMAYIASNVSNQPEDIDIISLVENYDAVKKVIVEYQPDMLHSVQLNPTVELVSRELGIPHIMNIYPLIPEFFSVLYLDVFPHYHICDSWYWAEKWHKYLNTDYTCIRTVSDMVEGVTQKIRNCKKTRYICVGSVCRGKNQMEVIKAFHKALSDGILGELHIYGHNAGEYANICQEYIERNSLDESIYMEGYTQDMKTVYGNSDVLICGSVRESYPNVISEALAYGLIIISTPVAGVPEVIADGINGYLADGYTGEEISRKIWEYHQDIGSEKLESIRINARNTFLKYHSREAVSDALIKYYEHVKKDYNLRFCSGVVISDIKGIFKEWLDLYRNNIKHFSAPQHIAKKIWYLYYIKNDILYAIGRKVYFYIWGAGKYGKSVKEMLDLYIPELTISGYIDSKKEGEFIGYRIYNPEKILKENHKIIFIALMAGQEEIIEQLESAGMKYNKDYFVLSDRVW